MTASDHLSGQQFYRAHRKGEEFSADEAWSAPLNPDAGDDEQRGYSAFEHPHELVDYVHSGKHQDLSPDRMGEREVLKFSGDRVGTGVDGEPLVVPHGAPSQRMNWDEFMTGRRPQ